MKKPDWKEWLNDKKVCKEWRDYYLKSGILRKGARKPEQYFKKAVHNLDFSNWLLEKHKDEIPSIFAEERFFDWVITGYYYSMYHAALALIASKNLFSKSHLATLCALVLYFYHENKLSKEEIEIVAESIGKTIDEKDVEIIVETKSLRERATYNVSYDFEESLVKTAKQNAIKFTENVRSILQIN